ncbi:MAG: hypothetical protein KTR31_20165 [Myxococcales bacterium]|nr:hypothetical protein [Myxococcales bacterium]
MARFSADGNHLWTRSIGGPWQTVLDAITYDPIADALIVVGHARGQPYQPVVVGIDQPDALELDTGAVQAIVLALSTEGTPMWASALDGLAYTSAVAVLPDGDVAVGGYFSGPFGTLEAAAADQAWVARLSPGGEVRWQIQGNTDNGPSYTEALAPGPDDTVVWGGTAAGQPGFGQTGTGLALAGDTESTPFLVLVDADGHPRCAQRIAQGPHFWYYERQTMHDIASVRLRPDGRVSVVGDGRLPIVLDPDGGLRNEVPDEAGHEAAFEVVVELGVP